MPAFPSPQSTTRSAPLSPSGSSIAPIERSFSILETAFDSIRDGILITDAAGRILGFNRPFAEMWSLPEEVRRTHDDDAAVAFARHQVRDPDAFVRRVREIYAAPESEAHDTLHMADGRIIERHSIPQRLDGAVVGRVWSFRDVTEDATAQDALRTSESRFRAVFDHSAVGIALVEADGRIAEVNSALQQFLGYTTHELRDRRFYHFVPDEETGDVATAVAAVATGAATSLTIEQRYVRKDGDVVWAALTMSRAAAHAGEHADGASAHAPVGVIAMVQDISRRKSLEARLTHQASHDPLTNLANRTLFKQRVELALQRAQQRERVVVMFLDLDNFKAVNDSLGHGAGDQLLVTAAARLLNATRGSDTVARLGGDEFAILLENVRDDDETRIVAERIARAMRQPITIGPESVVVGASIGIARPHAECEGADEILRNADVAMYTAKGAGKGRYQFFEPSMHTAVVDRLELENDLRRALTAGELELHYQPLVQLDSERVVGAEALLRWAHARRGLLQPTDFIGIAEDTGLIVPIGRWVLREACRQAHAWWHDLPDDEHMSIAVNVSGRQLQDPSFVADVAEALADSGLAPARLVLEITETIIMQHTGEMLGRLHELKALGVQLAIDDFGTGYSSLSYLQQFPIDIIKIDKAFIEGLARDPAGAAVTRTIIGLGWTLGLSTIAEGIEAPQQRAMLHELGCTLGQGFLFARPLAPHEASQLQRPVRTPES
jgi:diguanylate cyclase (GGDEF)-like protein/PAS domain S-box-containing protein